MALLLISVTIVLSLGQVTYGYPTFRQNIPNGEVVPSPCNPNYVWQGVGHKIKGGGGARNPFGEDFDANSYTWTEALCRRDSDGDGRSNGEELGDPDCRWTKGEAPQTSTGLSHPGICEPITSELCMQKNDFLDCSEQEFVCDALSDPDIVSHEIRLTQSPVPEKVTTYMCQILDLPADKEYHLVAAKPYVDNVNVLHHILVYACDDSGVIPADMFSPQECFMNRLSQCQNLIAMWSVGSNGACYHENAGFRLGLGSYKKVLMQMHWNNPLLESTYTDSSGMTLYMTPNLRPYDAGTIMIGQTLLIIPPGQEKFGVNSTCSSDCTTEKMSGDIYVVAAFNHMHYLGSSGVSYVTTQDERRFDLAADDVYNYDTPKFYQFDEPIRVEPGAELNLECYFKSTSRSKTTFFGRGTSDEMCLSFLIYYPKENWQGGTCVSQGPISECEWKQPTVRGCDVTKMGDLSDPETAKLIGDVSEYCYAGFCAEECKEVARRTNEHPCFQWPLGYIFRQQLLRTEQDQAKRLYEIEWNYKLNSCAAELAREKCETRSESNQGGGMIANGGEGHSTSLMTLIFVLFFCFVISKDHKCIAL